MQLAARSPSLAGGECLQQGAGRGGRTCTTNRSQFCTHLKSGLTLTTSRSYECKAKLLFTSKMSYKCKRPNKLATACVCRCPPTGWIKRAEQGGTGSAPPTLLAPKLQFLFHRQLWHFQICFHLPILSSIPNFPEKVFGSVDRGGLRLPC